MPISSKLRAEYVELINQALDTIPILKPADFGTAIHDLEKILTNASGAIDFDPELKESMEMVHEYYTQPELYVATRVDDAEYQQIIKDRIQAKISEFNSFSPAQKYQYVSDQKAARNQAAQHQQIMATGESKRVEHTRTMEAESSAQHERLVREQQTIEAQIQRSRQRPVAPTEPQLLRARLIARFQDSAPGRLSVERESQLSDIERIRILQLSDYVVRGDLSVDRALQLSNEQVNMLVTGGISTLTRNGRLSVDHALELTLRQRNDLLNNLNDDAQPSYHLGSLRSVQPIMRERSSFAWQPQEGGGWAVMRFQRTKIFVLGTYHFSQAGTQDSLLSITILVIRLG